MKYLTTLVTLLLVSSLSVLAGPRSLEEFGDISNVKAAEATLKRAIDQLMKDGGGTISIPPNAPKYMKIVNDSQKNRHKHGVTVIDYREGFITVDTAPIGGPGSSAWAGVKVNRHVNLGKDDISVDPYGCYVNQSISNYVTSGVSSIATISPYATKAGKDVRVYIESPRGVWVGQKIAYRSPNEVITVKALGWEKELQKNYLVCDLKKDHKSGAILMCKHVVGGLWIDNWSNCSNQTAGDLVVQKRHYANGDSFVMHAMHYYMSDIISGYGDEMGVTMCAENVGDLESFKSKVESIDPKNNELTYAPGKSNAQTLSDGRPLINMNKKKWLTKGKVMIVAPDEWYGYQLLDKNIDSWKTVLNGIDVNSFKFTMDKDGKQVPAVIDYRNLPVKKFSSTYKGKAYPSLIAKKPGLSFPNNYLGGCIIGSKDCGWTKDVVGRFFTITDDSEVVTPKDPQFGFAATPSHPAYRWYMINHFQENPDGTKTIKILRVRWSAIEAGSPLLFLEDHYTRDGHEKPLSYAIAPGAWVASVAKGWVDCRQRGGLTYKNESRIIGLLPSSTKGTELDFAPGDEIVQAVGPDPWHPCGFRIREFHQMPSMGSGGSIEITQSSRVQVDKCLQVGGGIMYRSQLKRPKDQKPSYDTLVDFATMSRVGIEFAAEILDAAILFKQPNGYRQAMVWKNQIERDNVMQVDPKTGIFELKGSGIELNDQGIAKAAGISATKVQAQNLRGINVAVSSGSSQLAVKFPTSEADANYSITVQPNWNTNDWITEKTEQGFTVKFSAAAPANAKLDWQLIR